MKRKGQAINFTNAPTIAVIFGVLVFIIASMAVAITSFKETQCSGYWDGSNCWTDSNANVSSQTYAHNATGQGLVGMDNFADQTPTIGTMLGVALIVVVIVGAFGIFFLRGRGAGF